MTQTIHQNQVEMNVLWQLKNLKETLYTGKWEVKTSQQAVWFFYFRLGRLIWCEGGKNNEERWQQYLNIYSPQLVSNNQKEDKYQTLASLYQERKLSKDNLVQWVSSFAEEVILDLVQVTETQELYNKKIPDQIPSLLISLISIEPLLNSVYQVWQSWKEEGLANYPLSSYLKVQDQEQLLNENRMILNQELIALMDGTLTLRGMAAKTQVKLVQLSQILIPFIKSGAIALSSEPALKPSPQQQTYNHSGEKILTQIQSSKKVIACIDDSVGVCEQLKALLTAASYEAVMFQNPATALSQLLKNPPDLIFLDIMMPIISGYELCKQMRRAPRLKTVPIIILTGKDGWVDRAKAKMCGATDFLSKPVRKEKLFEAINQYLSYEV
ncbi:response regulator receiver protein [Halothece sp. PCC 7418]|uniref:response regulator n=1 Tax=Halothece sp. (strain PCC 7418) TaxID=65093 RepID=UPI0002A0678C|nr:response regulator [Halothece sp. PCC 7418]AFZ44000.1 response regulator receiver protein [Halothece sp. PCC 7418]